MKNTLVSVFENVYATKPTESKTLYSICTSSEYEEIVSLLRSMQKGSEDYNTLKKTLPCFTPSMECTQRGAEYMTAHSGYVCIDWDNIDNPTEFKQTLKDFKFIAFAAESCSGKGVYAMVKVEKPNLHSQHYEALLEFFDRLGYPADTHCKDIARLRIVSYDPTSYYNADATVWCKVKLPQQYTNTTQVNTDGSDINERAIYTVRNYVVANSIDITSGRGNWLALGNYIYSIMGITGKSIFRDISQFHPKYNETECDKQFDKFGNSRYNTCIGVLLNACKRAGVPNLKELL